MTLFSFGKGWPAQISGMTMKSFMLALALAALPAAAQNAPSPAAARSAKLQDCLHTPSIRQTQAAADRHWYARTRDGKWWRNTMDCPALAPGRALVHSSPIGSQCRGDIVQIVDFTLGGISFGGCGLGAWEPVDSPPEKAKKTK